MKRHSNIYPLIFGIIMFIAGLSSGQFVYSLIFGLIPIALSIYLIVDENKKKNKQNTKRPESKSDYPICSDCGIPVPPGLRRTALGKVYCYNCFSKMFSPPRSVNDTSRQVKEELKTEDNVDTANYCCSVCKNKVKTDSVIIRNGIIYCRECFKNQPDIYDEKSEDDDADNNTIRMSFEDAAKNIPGFYNGVYMLAEYKYKRYIARKTGNRKILLFIKDDESDGFEISINELSALYRFGLTFAYKDKLYKANSIGENVVQIVDENNKIISVSTTDIEYVQCTKITVI